MAGQSLSEGSEETVLQTPPIATEGAKPDEAAIDVGAIVQFLASAGLDGLAFSGKLARNQHKEAAFDELQV